MEKMFFNFLDFLLSTSDVYDHPTNTCSKIKKDVEIRKYNILTFKKLVVNKTKEVNFMENLQNMVRQTSAELDY